MAVHPPMTEFCKQTHELVLDLSVNPFAQTHYPFTKVKVELHARQTDVFGER